MSGFTRATKSAAKARIGLYGVSGSGKTMHALSIARVLAGPEGSIALLDTEGGSASKYADLFEFDSNMMRKPYHPERFAKALDAAVSAGYDVFVADGVSPFWNGEGGVMSIVDAAKKRGGGWADGTPAHNKLVDAILTSPIHVIITVRSKAETVVENVNGKVTYRKLGTKMVQRDELDYELDVLLYLDLDNSATVEKSRMPDQLGRTIPVDDVVEWAGGFKEWLAEGTKPVPPIEFDPATEPDPIVVTHPSSDVTPKPRQRVTAEVVPEVEDDELLPLRAQLTHMSAQEKADLWRYASLAAGTKMADVKSRLVAYADELRVEFTEEPNARLILDAARAAAKASLPDDAVEEFDHFAQTGQDLEADPQTAIA